MPTKAVPIMKETILERLKMGDRISQVRQGKDSQ